MKQPDWSECYKHGTSITINKYLGFAQYMSYLFNAHCVKIFSSNTFRTKLFFHEIFFNEVFTNEIKTDYGIFGCYDESYNAHTQYTTDIQVT